MKQLCSYQNWLVDGNLFDHLTDWSALLITFENRLAIFLSFQVIINHSLNSVLFFIANWFATNNTKHIETKWYRIKTLADWHKCSEFGLNLRCISSQNFNKNACFLHLSLFITGIVHIHGICHRNIVHVSKKTCLFRPAECSLCMLSVWFWRWILTFIQNIQRMARTRVKLVAYGMASRDTAHGL